MNDGHLGGKVDQGRNTVVLQAISGGRSLILQALAWQVGAAVHVSTIDNRKNREKGGSYFG